MVGQRRSWRCLHSMHSVARGNACSRILPIGLTARLADAVGAVLDPGQGRLDDVQSRGRSWPSIISWSRSKVLEPTSAWSLPAPSPPSRSRWPISSSVAAISSLRRWASCLERRADLPDLLGRPGRLALAHGELASPDPLGRCRRGFAGSCRRGRVSIFTGAAFLAGAFLAAASLLASAAQPSWPAFLAARFFAARPSWLRPSWRCGLLGRGLLRGRPSWRLPSWPVPSWPSARPSWPGGLLRRGLLRRRPSWPRLLRRRLLRRRLLRRRLLRGAAFFAGAFLAAGLLRRSGLLRWRPSSPSSSWRAALRATTRIGRTRTSVGSPWRRPS